MEKNDFNCSFSAKISAGEAIKKISNVPDWWGVTFTGSAEKQKDKFTIKMGGDSFFNFMVAELIPGKRVVWLVTDCNMPWYSDKKEWANTKLIFDLHENKGETELSFKHEGLTPDVECYKDCKPGWTHWIKTSLFSYFTTGKGVFRPSTMTNKNYKAANYTVEIEVAKSPNDVFNHVINLSKWWPEEFEGESIKLNTEFVFRTGDTHYSKNKVVEFVPNKKVVWVTTESIRKTDNYDWTGTKFIFVLSPQGDNTPLKFTYDGVVLENESDRLVQICDMTIKEILYNFITYGKTKFHGNH